MDVGGATRWAMTGVVLARRDPGPDRRALRRDRAVARGDVGAGRSLSATGRHGVRHHRLDHRAVLPLLRPRPPHRRRHVVPVPLCAPGSGSARRPARWRVAAGDRGTSSPTAGAGATTAAPSGGSSGATARRSWRGSRSAPGSRTSRCTRAADRKSQGLPRFSARTGPSVAASSTASPRFPVPSCDCTPSRSARPCRWRRSGRRSACR